MMKKRNYFGNSLLFLGILSILLFTGKKESAEAAEATPPVYSGVQFNAGDGVYLGMYQQLHSKGSRESRKTPILFDVYDNTAADQSNRLYAHRLLESVDNLSGGTWSTYYYAQSTGRVWLQSLYNNTATYGGMLDIDQTVIPLSPVYQRYITSDATGNNGTRNGQPYTVQAANLFSYQSMSDHFWLPTGIGCTGPVSLYQHYGVNAYIHEDDNLTLSVWNAAYAERMKSTEDNLQQAYTLTKTHYYYVGTGSNSPNRWIVYDYHANVGDNSAAKDAYMSQWSLPSTSSYIRPVSKIKRDNVIYASPINSTGANIVGETARSATNTASAPQDYINNTNSGKKNYRLTVVNQASTAPDFLNPWQLAYQQNDDLSIATGKKQKLTTTTNVTSDYQLAYKIVDSSGAIVKYGEGAADAEEIEVDSSLLGKGAYDLFIWVQETNAKLPIGTKTASKPMILDLLVTGASIITQDLVLEKGAPWSPVDNFVSATDEDGAEVTSDDLRISYTVHNSDMSPADNNTINTNNPGDYYIVYRFDYDELDENHFATARGKITVQNTHSLNVQDLTRYVGDTWYSSDHFLGGISKTGVPITFSDLASVSHTVPVDNNKLTTITGAIPHKISYTYDDKTVQANLTILQNQASINLIPLIEANGVTLYVGDEYDAADYFLNATDKTGAPASFDAVTVTAISTAIDADPLAQVQVSTSSVGSYSVTYSIDGASKTVPVQVLENQAEINLDVTNSLLYVGDTWHSFDNLLSAKDKTGLIVPTGQYSSKIKVTGSVDTSKVGFNYVTYSIDGVNETATIEVRENQADMITKEVIIKVGGLWSPAMNVVEVYGKDGVEINLSTITYDPEDLTASLYIPSENTVNRAIPGTYSVTYHYAGKDYTDTVLVVSQIPGDNDGDGNGDDGGGNNNGSGNGGGTTNNNNNNENNVTINVDLDSLTDRIAELLEIIQTLLENQSSGSVSSGLTDEQLEAILNAILAIAGGNTTDNSTTNNIINHNGITAEELQTILEALLSGQSGNGDSITNITNNNGLTAEELQAILEAILLGQSGDEATTVNVDFSGLTESIESLLTIIEALLEQQTNNNGLTDEQLQAIIQAILEKSGVHTENSNNTTTDNSVNYITNNGLSSEELKDLIETIIESQDKTSGFDLDELKELLKDLINNLELPSVKDGQTITNITNNQSGNSNSQGSNLNHSGDNSSDIGGLSFTDSTISNIPIGQRLANPTGNGSISKTGSSQLPTTSEQKKSDVARIGLLLFVITLSLWIYCNRIKC